MSILGRIGKNIQADANAIVDSAEEWNSVPLLNQHIRDLSDASKNLNSQLLSAQYTLKKTKERVQQHEDGITEAKTNIANIRQSAKNNNPGGKPTESQDQSIRKYAADGASFAALAKTDATAVQKAQSDYDHLQDAARLATAKLAEFTGRRDYLLTEKATAKTQDKATAAINAIKSVTESAGSIDSLTDKIERQKAQSDGAFEAALKSMGAAGADKEAATDAFLASLDAESHPAT